MPSKLLRRSGAGVVAISNNIGWGPPSAIYQAGIGMNHQEIECFAEEWPTAKLYGWDPNPRVFDDIKRDYYGTHYPIGLSDKPGKATMYVAPRHRDGGTLYPFTDKKRDHATFDVELTTLDIAVPEGPEENSLLWLDCEGHELAVLKGAEKFMAKENGIVVVNCEMTGKPNSEGWVDQVDVHKYLTNLGFHIQWSSTQRSFLGQQDLIYVKPHLFKEELCNSPWSIMHFREKHGRRAGK